MQKRSHWLLASALLHSHQGFSRKRFEWAFLLGSCQPDCNPLSYLKGSLRAQLLRGHNFSNSQPYMDTRIRRLRQHSRWTLWQYYTLGKLTHYLADAFTYPHNPHFPASLLSHRRYEHALRLHLQEYLTLHAVPLQPAQQDLEHTLSRLHQQYVQAPSDPARDIAFILRAAGLLLATCTPERASFPQHAQKHTVFAL